MRRLSGGGLLPAALTLLITASGCSFGDGGRALCDDRSAIVAALDRVGEAAEPDATAVDGIRDAAALLRDTEVDASLQGDVDLLVEYLEVVADVAASDLEDPQELSSLEQRITRLEAQIDQARDAAASVRDALDDCPD